MCVCVCCRAGGCNQTLNSELFMKKKKRQKPRASLWLAVWTCVVRGMVMVPSSGWKTSLHIVCRGFGLLNSESKGLKRLLTPVRSTVLGMSQDTIRPHPPSPGCLCSKFSYSFQTMVSLRSLMKREGVRRPSVHEVESCWSVSHFFFLKEKLFVSHCTKTFYRHCRDCSKLR